jgi:hypothetical protein
MRETTPSSEASNPVADGECRSSSSSSSWIQKHTSCAQFSTKSHQMFTKTRQIFELIHEKIIEIPSDQKHDWNAVAIRRESKLPRG